MHASGSAREPGRVGYSVSLESSTGNLTSRLPLTTGSGFNKCDAGTIYFPNVAEF